MSSQVFKHFINNNTLYVIRMKYKLKNLNVSHYLNFYVLSNIFEFLSKLKLKTNFFELIFSYLIFCQHYPYD